MYNILIADDEYLEREVIKKIVGSIWDAGVVGDANTGQKAVALCLALKPDLIFLNLSMGGIGGLGAAKNIRRNDKQVTIIFTTACEKSISHQELKTLDISEYLLKPIRPSKVSEVIQRNMGSRAPRMCPPVGAKKDLQFYPAQLFSKEIAKAISYIDGNYRQKISLDDVAAAVHLSSYYFSRLFKKEVGVNFSGYILHKKLDEARRLLETSDRAVLDIARELGFTEQSYFCKVFRKHLGVAPTQYRCQSRSNVSEIRNLVDKFWLHSQNS